MLRISRIKIRSSSINSVGRDAATNQMDVEFRNGSVYRYQNVTTTTWNEFISSASKGQFFMRVIRDNPERFPSTKLTPEQASNTTK